MGGDPWLLPPDLAEIEAMIDHLGVEAYKSNDEAGYFLNREAHMMAARLPSSLPSASAVAWAGLDNVAGHNRRTEGIFLVKPHA